MKLTMLGTGHAMVTDCYNTCFVIEDEGNCFLVDGGGGNTVLRQLKMAGYNPLDIRHIFVTHKHIDHLMGIIWMVRAICHAMCHDEYDGEAYIYSHDEVVGLIRDIAGRLLTEKEAHCLNEGLHLVEVHDGEIHNIIGHEVTFFDIQSSKAKQYGFCLETGYGERLVCCGDEPFSECERQYAEGCKWMLHEAFCLHSQADIFEPYEKHHSTVMDACKTAEELGVRNLVLYHTEDSDIQGRKSAYIDEGRQFFHGNLYVPEDLECIEL